MKQNFLIAINLLKNNKTFIFFLLLNVVWYSFLIIDFFTKIIFVNNLLNENIVSNFKQLDKLLYFKSFSLFILSFLTVPIVSVWLYFKRQLFLAYFLLTPIVLIYLINLVFWIIIKILFI